MFSNLKHLGWQSFFQQQLLLEEWDTVLPARVVEQNKSRIQVVTAHEKLSISLTAHLPEMVVGDWLLLNQKKEFIRLLERKSSFARKAPGSAIKQQLISANVDTAFIVCSMNKDFNLNRLERFLSLVNEAQAEPVVVLSKRDLALTDNNFVEIVQSLDALLMVESVNCLDIESLKKLSPWIKEGQTIAVLGSSGVGKSTLMNTLLGRDIQQTSDIREQDSKGRHTTTHRSLVLLPGGGLMLDTPGMRQIQLAQCKEGIASTFSDIEALTMNCQFSDCQHQDEPGCAIQKAIESEELPSRRLANYHKLQKEALFNSACLSERRAADKALGKFYKNSHSQGQKFKGR
jgi:ribosome biogenesis GTPase